VVCDGRVWIDGDGRLDSTAEVSSLVRQLSAFLRAHLDLFRFSNVRVLAEGRLDELPSGVEGDAGDGSDERAVECPLREWRRRRWGLRRATGLLCQGEGSAAAPVGQNGWEEGGARGEDVRGAEG
jgi:hypothetical protein